MKKAAVINDLSSFGKCSLTAAIPVLSILGIQACPLPTAVLTGQTGYEHYHMYSFTDKLKDFTHDWKVRGVQFDGVYSGFVPDCRQQKEILYFMESFCRKDTVCLVDPVMGDNGEVFHGIYSEELREGMIEMLGYSNLSTPNITEACLLTGTSYEKLHAYKRQEDYFKGIEEIGKRVCQMGKEDSVAVISGIKYTDHKTSRLKMGNMAVSQKQSVYLERDYLGGNYSGTGDLFASCLFGYQLLGIEPFISLDNTMDFILYSIMDTTKEDTSGNDGVCFENHLMELRDILK